MDTETNPLLTALHTHIQAVAARPIDIRMLVELEKTCLLARELMVVGQQPDATQKRSLIYGGNNSLGIGYDSVGGGMVAMPSYQGVASAAYSSPQETFGVTAIREMVNALSSFMPKPKDDSISDLTSALATAKLAGDTELEQQLRAALREKLGQPPREVTVTPLPAPELEGAAA